MSTPPKIWPVDRCILVSIYEELGPNDMNISDAYLGFYNNTIDKIQHPDTTPVIVAEYPEGNFNLYALLSNTVYPTSNPPGPSGKKPFNLPVGSVTAGNGLLDLLNDTIGLSTVYAVLYGPEEEISDPGTIGLLDHVSDLDAWNDPDSVIGDHPDQLVDATNDQQADIMWDGMENPMLMIPKALVVRIPVLYNKLRKFEKEHFFELRLSDFLYQLRLSDLKNHLDNKPNF
ncbi:hypothetical protein K9N50_03270 [bacterium]|nr:hypothetical protein [bacterium]